MTPCTIFYLFGRNSPSSQSLHYTLISLQRHYSEFERTQKKLHFCIWNQFGIKNSDFKIGKKIMGINYHVKWDKLFILSKFAIIAVSPQRINCTINTLFRGWENKIKITSLLIKSIQQKKQMFVIVFFGEIIIGNSYFLFIWSKFTIITVSPVYIDIATKTLY